MVISNKMILISEVCTFRYIFLFDPNSCNSCSCSLLRGVNLFNESMLFVMALQVFDNFLLMKCYQQRGMQIEVVSSNPVPNSETPVQPILSFDTENRS